MKVLSLELPVMYGDHHVLEVRRLLLEMLGVEDVYASSGFHAAEINYDPEKISETAIITKLDEAGYIGELPIPVETGVAAYQGGRVDTSLFRRSTANKQTLDVMGFAQNVSSKGRSLWPCPGMEPLKPIIEEK